MTEDETCRLATVRKLLDLSEPLEAVMEKLSQFSWDYDKTGVELERKHVGNALERYLRGEMEADQIENWANAIEGRDDIDFDPVSDPVLEEVIYELANPTLTQNLSERRAVEILNELASKT